ncbi:MAG: metal-dependent hydrolase [Bacteroidetes bacterium]|nr:MAG: metal-dependent hydrolase [Bacteroidota bacterium]
MLKLTYLSHSSFLLDDGTHQIVIDPFITGNPNSPVKPSDIKAKFVVLTHAHGDHLGDGLTIAKQNEGLVIAVNELANYAAEQGCITHNMHIGGGWNFPFGRLKFTIAHHGSGSPEGRYMGEPAGVVIKMGGKIVYHAGDTGLFLDMKLIGEIDKIDAFLVPIGDNFTMGIDDALRAVEFVNPALTIPMHYNTFPVIQVDPEQFKAKLAKNEKECKVMNFGESIEL